MVILILILKKNPFTISCDEVSRHTDVRGKDRKEKCIKMVRVNALQCVQWCVHNRGEVGDTSQVT